MALSPTGAQMPSQRYDYFKFPGGGIQPNESKEDALVREVAEEVGLEVIRDSIKEYGLVYRKEKGRYDDIFIQENYYYLCDVTDNVIKQSLDDYEDYEGFTLVWTDPNTAIETNLYHDHKEKFTPNGQHMMEREAKVLKILIEEGLV